MVAVAHFCANTQEHVNALLRFCVIALHQGSHGGCSPYLCKLTQEHVNALQQFDCIMHSA